MKLKRFAGAGGVAAWQPLTALLAREDASHAGADRTIVQKPSSAAATGRPARPARQHGGGNPPVQGRRAAGTQHEGGNPPTDGSIRQSGHGRLPWSRRGPPRATAGGTADTPPLPHARQNSCGGHRGFPVRHPVRRERAPALLAARAGGDRPAVPCGDRAPRQRAAEPGPGARRRLAGPARAPARPPAGRWARRLSADGGRGCVGTARPVPARAGPA